MNLVSAIRTSRYNLITEVHTLRMDIHPGALYKLPGGFSDIKITRSIRLRISNARQRELNAIISSAIVTSVQLMWSFGFHPWNSVKRSQRRQWMNVQSDTPNTSEEKTATATSSFAGILSDDMSRYDGGSYVSPSRPYKLYIQEKLAIIEV